MKPLTSYEIWQLQKYGNIIAEKEVDETEEVDPFDKQVEIIELQNQES